ncbi:MAG TPA: lysophospholipid acyltransferase family protein [Solirubrobacteraceae bacterium]|nr:lysophospholipid acyltransferase family protein [Solirubrobacteraceae bacterium]
MDEDPSAVWQDAPFMDRVERVTGAYRTVMALAAPAVRWWGRLDVQGLEHLPLQGPVLLVGNHDSYWDPVTIGIAGLPRRQIRALAKASLWKPGMGWILDGMGQIPIDRGAGDARALDRAVAELRAGACIGVFPEGTRSLGRELRARSGLGRLAHAVPEAELVCCTVLDTVDIPKFPSHRPHVSVRFFAPQGSGLRPGEEPVDLSRRLLAEIRAQAPIRIAGRRRAKRIAAGGEPGR